MLKVRLKRDARELRHLRLALPHYFLKFLGADLTSSSAAEYAIAVMVRHTFLLSAFGLLMVIPEGRWMPDKRQTMQQSSFKLAPDQSCLETSHGVLAR